MIRTGPLARCRAPLACLAMACVALLAGPGALPTQGHVGETPFATITGPGGVAATPGRLYVTSPFCGNPRTVLSIDSSGVVSGFATLPARPSGCFEDYIAVAGPADLSKPGFPSPTKGGFISNYLYVAQGAQILQITPEGVVSPFTTIPYCGRSHTGITFDLTGSFGYKMLVTCEGGKIWTVAATGAPTLVANVAAALGLASVLIENPNVAPQSFHPYGGHLFVAAEKLGKVLAVSPSGAVKRVATWPGAEGVNFIPDTKCDVGASGGTFFTAIKRKDGPGTIVKFPLSAFAGKSGRALVTSESSAGIGLLTPTGDPTIVPTLFHSSIGKHEGSAFADCTVPLLLAIEVTRSIIRLGGIESSNSGTPGINPNSPGTTRVAVLSSPIFDALTQPVISSIRFGVTGTENSIKFCNAGGEDVNGDGRKDLICHGETRKLGIIGTNIYHGLLTLKLEYLAAGGDPAGEGSD
jgi:hypothetical protein